MKLDHDCIRAVLLYLERELRCCADTDGSIRFDSLSLSQISDAVSKFSREDVFYSLFNLDQSGYISASFLWLGNGIGECSVSYLTFAGHQYLEQIRDDRRWAFIKKGLAAVGNCSLSVIGTIAEGISAGAVSAYLESL